MRKHPTSFRLVLAALDNDPKELADALTLVRTSVFNEKAGVGIGTSRTSGNFPAGH